MNNVFCITDGHFIYFKFKKEENQKITAIDYIGSDNKPCNLPIMGEKVFVNIKDIGFPRSNLFFEVLNNLNISSGEYILEMKCIKAGCGGMVRDFYEGISLYKKAEFKIKNTNNKKEKICKNKSTQH